MSSKLSAVISCFGKTARGGCFFFSQKTGRWRGSDSRTKRQAEIDLVASDGANYIFSECKWRKEKFDLSALQDFKDKSALFGSRSAGTGYALFSQSGFSRTVMEAAKENKCLMLFCTGDLLGKSNEDSR